MVDIGPHLLTALGYLAVAAIVIALIRKLL